MFTLPKTFRLVIPPELDTQGRIDWEKEVILLLHKLGYPYHLHSSAGINNRGTPQSTEGHFCNTQLSQIQGNTSLIYCNSGGCETTCCDSLCAKVTIPNSYTVEYLRDRVNNLSILEEIEIKQKQEGLLSFNVQMNGTSYTIEDDNFCDDFD